MVIAAIMGCFILVVVTLIMKEFLDESLSNPLNVLKVTGLPTATAFIRFGKEHTQHIDDINNLSYERWMLSLIDWQQQHRGIKLLVVPFHVTSHPCEELINTLMVKLKAYGYQWQSESLREDLPKDTNILICSNTSKRELIHKNILAQCDGIILILNAAEKMDEYQMQILENWKKIKLPIQAVLVETKTDHLEKFLGEIPKNRSYIRMRIKDIIRRYSK
jgi:hypothetical protein